MGKYDIRKGTPCEVRPLGGGKWRSHVTTRHLSFEARGVADGGGKWLFVRDGWELKVSPAKVLHAKAGPRSRPVATTDRGRGVSRRRAARTIAAWKNRR